MDEKDQKKAVKQWMQLHANEYKNSTELAEDAAHYAVGDNDEWLDDPDHWVWELAIDAKPEN